MNFFFVLIGSQNHQDISPSPYENDDDGIPYLKGHLQCNDDTPLEDEHEEEEDEEEHKSMAALEAELQKYLSDD